MPRAAMESVEVRQRGAYDFENHYKYLCSLQETVPLPAVTSRLSYGLLDLNGDRIRVEDWPPILNTLRINKSLDTVVVRSCYTPSNDDRAKRIPRLGKKKSPACRSKDVKLRLCKALCSCLSVTPSLSCIELCGLPLGGKDVQALSAGIMKNKTLKLISLELCKIGDACLEIVCLALKNAYNISTANFTGCSLSWKSAICLAAVIKHQGIKRHNEAWQDSLRYRTPDLDRILGLRRLTLNCNPLFGHQGAALLADALKDDHWLKALDMQACGVSNTGAKALRECLEYNGSLIVLDIRNNPLVEPEVLHKMMEQLMFNSNNKENEHAQYKWLPDVKSPKEASEKQKPRRRSTKLVGKSATRQTTIKVSVGSDRGGRQTASRRLSFIGTTPKPGLPWRTAARAHRYKGFAPEPASECPDTSEVGSTHISITEEESMADIYPLTSPSPARLVPGSAGGKRTPTPTHPHRVSSATRVLSGTRSESRPKSQKPLLEREMKMLLVENRKLQEEVNYYRRVFSDSMLDAVEASFRQMNDFLDKLEAAGLGKLITMGGLDRSQIPMSFVEGWNNTSRSSASGASPTKASAPRGQPAAGAAGDVEGTKKLSDMATGGNGKGDGNNNNNSSVDGKANVVDDQMASYDVDQSGMTEQSLGGEGGDGEKMVMVDSMEFEDSHFDYTEESVADSPSKGE